jgi:hypothetical protein
MSQQNNPNKECNCKSLQKQIDKLYEEIVEIRKLYEKILKVVKSK